MAKTTKTVDMEETLWRIKWACKKAQAVQIALETEYFGMAEPHGRELLSDYPLYSSYAQIVGDYLRQIMEEADRITGVPNDQ
ncbi:Uncharacterised protein [uncultured Anaerotruncus sp.]|uniref:Uncharacterized protein n=1 Tax=uncultured Anaerotruncus sp. TaxID=905011 RepID=A0A6N2UIS8_9FIRM